MNRTGLSWPIRHIELSSEVSLHTRVGLVCFALSRPNQRWLPHSNASQATLVSSVSRPFSSADGLVEYRPGEIGRVSGIPDEHLARKVVIYSPARTASQQGSGKTGKWKINFVSTQKWENPLMGWTSTGDPYANVGDSALGFESEEAAKYFAQNHGWEYVVKKRHTPLLKVKLYADNFKWKAPPPKTEA